MRNLACKFPTLLSLFFSTCPTKATRDPAFWYGHEAIWINGIGFARIVLGFEGRGNNRAPPYGQGSPACALKWGTPSPLPEPMARIPAPCGTCWTTLRCRISSLTTGGAKSQPRWVTPGDRVLGHMGVFWGPSKIGGLPFGFPLKRLTLPPTNMAPFEGTFCQLPC